jgi:hypothetical protein
MQPHPGTPESLRNYLHQRREVGCRHGRTLFAEIRKLGFVGCYSGLAKFISPWREAKAENRRPIPAFPDASPLEPATSTGSRQLSPQVAAALLSKARAELTSQQAQIVDTLKGQCPGFAVMRKLVFSFRMILRGGQGARAYYCSLRLAGHNMHQSCVRTDLSTVRQQLERTHRC